MPVLKINNFLKIKSAEIDMLPIVLLIGPQASGKSIIAKLSYFLKEFTSSEMMRALQEETTFTHFENEAKSKFKNIFPQYTWGKTEFTIEYIDAKNYVKISNKKTSTRYKFDIKCSELLKDVYEQINKQYQDKLLLEKSRRSSKEGFIPMSRFQIFREIVEEIAKNKHLVLNENSVFIPAGRSFFSNLKAFVFSFLSQSIDIDPFLKDFGRHLEYIKDSYYDVRSDLISTKYLLQIDKIVSEVLCGKYIYSNDEDWIVTNKKRIKVINSSSGQQESLPMLLVLSYHPFVYSRFKCSTFFIEEPEAHLFPLSQKKIIDLIGLAYNHKGNHNQFFITTHSPYVVSALNNLILASQVTLSNDIPDEIKALHGSSINFDNVSAYAVDNGTVRSIKDEENLIIDADYIDNVSNMFEKDYNILLDIIYESKKD